jgi:Holliday junction resolvase RusA-like endonuclease
MSDTPSPGFLRATHRPATLRTAPTQAVAAPSPQPAPVSARTEWTFVILGTPMGKPRMTQRDKWQKRPAVIRYRAWADAARAAVPEDMTDDPLTVSWTAYLPIPKSWSAKKREAMKDTLHRQKPDRDNIDKGVLDALFKSDCGVAAGTLVKRWDDGIGPRIIVKVSIL